jgi:hypothetical protein
MYGMGYRRLQDVPICGKRCSEMFAFGGLLQRVIEKFCIRNSQRLHSTDHKCAHSSVHCTPNHRPVMNARRFPS